MKFETPAGTNPIDQRRVIGKPTPRIDGPLKVTGTAPYAFERNDVAPGHAYGVIVGSAVAKGRIARIDTADAARAPGVIAIVTHENAGKLGKAKAHTATMLAGPMVEHYDQAVAIVVAETFEQARDAAKRVRVDYARAKGRYDLAAAKAGAPIAPGDKMKTAVGDFARAFAAAPVTVDATYTTPDQSHTMMEPHATIAAWDGDTVTLWTSNQMIAWAVRDMSETLLIPKEKIRVVSPYVGGGFGGKLWVRSDAVMAALAARAAKRPVKVALARAQIMNNTTHRPATIQRIRLGADRTGKITAIAHQTWSGDLPGGGPETAANQTQLLYAGANRLTETRLAVLDLPEANAMRAPGEAPGMMALEVAMDELAEKLGMDPVRLRILNDTQVDPEKPERPFSDRHLVRCLEEGAQRFGWARRSATPGKMRDGRWLVGMGVAAAFRNNMNMKSGARVGVDRKGMVTVATDMTDIGTGSYTILAQIAAETLGLPLDRVEVQLGDGAAPPSAGSGGSWGAGSAGSSVYLACELLREKLARAMDTAPESMTLKDGRAIADNRAVEIGELVGDGLSALGEIAPGKQEKSFNQASYGAHFAEVKVNAVTGEVRVERMLGVFAAGRILNQKTARSQCLGGMTFGIGAALTEELVHDPRNGKVVNRDLGEYHVPVNADVPQIDVHFLDERDIHANPIHAKGIGELGISGAGAAIANAIYNATGVRVRDYPITCDKLLEGLPG